MRQNNTSRFLVAILLGLILGGVIGESLGFLFGWLGELTGAGWDNNMRAILTHSFDLDLGFDDPAGFPIDLYLLKFRLGLGLKFNLASLLGLAIALYIERWSRAK